MLRGVQIDLETSRAAFKPLIEAYARDLRTEELSDDVVREVSTIVRSSRSALDKTANEVARRYGAGQKNPTYFPITTDPSAFEALLGNNIRGLRVTRPDIADAFERYQPYHSTVPITALQYLPQLYRVNAHHDYTLQTRQESYYFIVSIAGMTLIAAGPHGLTIGGAPPAGAVLINASVAESGDMKTISGTALDWHFVDPPVSVLTTLVRVHDASAMACEDISLVAAL